MAKYIVEITPSFEQAFQKLEERYPKIDDDFEEFLDEIEKNGDLGEDCSGVVKNGNKVFKKRMKNTSARKGKRGGFRVIEYLITSNNHVYLLDFYSKSDQENISNQQIRDLIEKNEKVFDYTD